MIKAFISYTAFIILMKQGTLGYSSLAAISKHVQAISLRCFSLKFYMQLIDKNINLSNIAVAVNIVSILYSKCTWSYMISSMHSARCRFEMIGRRWLT